MDASFIRDVRSGWSAQFQLNSNVFAMIPLAISSSSMQENLEMPLSSLIHYGFTSQRTKTMTKWLLTWNWTIKSLNCSYEVEVLVSPRLFPAAEAVEITRFPLLGAEPNPPLFGWRLVRPTSWNDIVACCVGCCFGRCNIGQLLYGSVVDSEIWICGERRHCVSCKMTCCRKDAPNGGLHGLLKYPLRSVDI